MMRHAIASALLFLFVNVDAGAFPPYRSTDADTAGERTIELRLGLLRIQRTGSGSQRTTPLTRTNFGIGENYEIVAEFEYSPDEHRVEEGALGFKWVRRHEHMGIGVETLLLLPVHSGQSGTGIESQFVTTFVRDRWQTHLNAGVFYDPRSPDTEHGWRGSVLAEFPRANFRPGVELFAKKTHGQHTRVQAGVGVISQLPKLQIRSGLHFGLSDAAPDVEASIWCAWGWKLRNQR